MRRRAPDDDAGHAQHLLRQCFAIHGVKRAPQLEQANLAHSPAQVVRHVRQQTGKQSGSEHVHLTAQGVTQRHHLPVKPPHAPQSLPAYETVVDGFAEPAGHHDPARLKLQGPGARRPCSGASRSRQGGGNVLVAHPSAHLFDEVDLAFDIGPESRNLDAENTVFLIAHEQPQGFEALPHPGGIQRYAEQTRCARYPNRHLFRRDGRRMRVHGPLGDGAARCLADEFGGQIRRANGARGVHPPFETIRRLRGHPQTPAGAPDGLRREISALEKNVAGVLVHLGEETPHHAADGDGFFTVANHEVLIVHRAPLTVERGEGAVALGPPSHDDFVFGEAVQVERVERLAE